METTVESTQRRRVALLLGNNELHNSKVITGIVEHVRQQVLGWNMLLLPSLDGGAAAPLAGYADAWIASSDDYDLGAWAGQGAVVVGLGEARRALSAGTPAVVSDNAAVAKQAYDYLISHGASRFALFSATTRDGDAGAQERDEAFVALARHDRADVAQLHCVLGDQPLFGAAMAELIDWLARLPKPVAVFAADASRARMLSQACALAGYDGDDQILIIGVDCDPLAQDLSPVPMASVMLDRQEMGRRAAQLLQQVLEGQPHAQSDMVAPLELTQAPHKANPHTYHPLIMRALHFIRLNARRGIKAEQVAYHVNLSRSSLETRFKRELGRSVHDEILRFKLEEAKQMLRSGASSMPDVAVRCGFTSVQYLYTVFGRELGCTPRVWQERMLRQTPLAQAA